MPDWLDDLALESIAPPPVWLPRRADRLAEAQLTLQRRFGRRAESSTRPSHRLQDTILIGGGPRIVSGDEIESEMEIELTTINPPIAQGWIVASGAIVFVATLFGIRSLIATPATTIGPALLGAAWPAAAWLATIVVVASRQHTIELDGDGVRVRTWLGRWTRSHGLLLGAAATVRARLTSRLHLELDSAAVASPLEVSLALWPHTARQDLVDELPIWGVECAFAHHRHRPDRGHRRRAARDG